MSSHPAGAVLIMLGVALVVIGLLVGWGGLGWFGRLPGDIRIERETVRVYIPIVSMIVISVILTLIFNLFRRFF
jgi:uncharacterized membrane protein